MLDIILISTVCFVCFLMGLTLGDSLQSPIVDTQKKIIVNLEKQNAILDLDNKCAKMYIQCQDAVINRFI